VEDNDIAAPPEVVGTNGTPTALRAVAWAATAILARAYTVAHRSEPGLETHTELPLLVVHAQHRPPDTHEPLLDELGAWLARWPDVPTEVRVLHGGAGEQVLHASRGARSLVLGTSGHNLAARAALGSTSRTLVRLAPCPVTVVRRNLDPAVAGTPAREVRVVGS